VQEAISHRLSSISEKAGFKVLLFFVLVFADTWHLTPGTCSSGLLFADTWHLLFR
jgi:hypothetical protein